MSDDGGFNDEEFKNQIWFKVQNDTAYALEAQGSFADFGEVSEPPSTVGPLGLVFSFLVLQELTQHRSAPIL